MNQDPSVLHPAAGHRIMPWRNGLGVTREIAAWPPGSDWETFEWRLSLAAMSNDGSFSSLPGIDRILVLGSHHPVLLTIDGYPRPMTQHDVVRFEGECAVTCQLDGRTSWDLNVMTRRGRWTADVAIVAGEEHVSAAADVVFVMNLAGNWACGGRDLRPWDSTRITDPAVLQGEGAAAIVRLIPVTMPPQRNRTLKNGARP